MPVPPVIVNPLTVAVTPASTVSVGPRPLPSSTVLPAPAPVTVRSLVTSTRSDAVAAVKLPAATLIVSPGLASPIAVSILAQAVALVLPHGALAAPPGATYQTAAALARRGQGGRGGSPRSECQRRQHREQIGQQRPARSRPG